jgi:hypothetical protein
MKASRKILLNLSILFTVVLVLTYCAPTPKIIRLKNIGEDYTLDDTQGKGVLIVSLTRSGWKGCSILLDLRGVDNDYKAEVSIIEKKSLFERKKVETDWKCPMFGKIPEDKPCGRLAIIELPQGEYEFFSWHGFETRMVPNSAGGFTRMQSSVFVWPPPEFSERFKVIAGKAAYLGNLHISLRKKLKMGRIHPYRDIRYKLKIADMSERDLPLFYQKNPMMTADKVVVNILQ